jgi:hypothetical protein
MAIHLTSREAPMWTLDELQGMRLGIMCFWQRNQLREHSYKSHM